MIYAAPFGGTRGDRSPRVPPNGAAYINKSQRGPTNTLTLPKHHVSRCFARVLNENYRVSRIPGMPMAGHRAQIDNTSVAAWPLAILKDIQRACGHRCAPRVMGTGPLQFGTVFGSFFGVQKPRFLGPFTCRRLGFAPKPQSHCTMAPGGASITSKNKPWQGTGHK